MNLNMRRTSLPAISLHKAGPSQHSSLAGGDVAVLLEAHGIVTEMLADPSVLPSNVVSGLKALAELLSPPAHNLGIPKNKLGPHFSLHNDPSYTSDAEETESPYTGEKPSSLPKLYKKNMPPCLLRRMSTCTWTTTTSATGLPTLEPEPCKKTRATFRHVIDGSPTTSPTRNPEVHHQAYKNRSQSSNSLTNYKKDLDAFFKERKTVCSLHPLSNKDISDLRQLAQNSTTQPSDNEGSLSTSPVNGRALSTSSLNSSRNDLVEKDPVECDPHKTTVPNNTEYAICNQCANNANKLNEIPSLEPGTKSERRFSGSSKRSACETLTEIIDDQEDEVSDTSPPRLLSEENMQVEACVEICDNALSSLTKSIVVQTLSASELDSSELSEESHVTRRTQFSNVEIYKPTEEIENKADRVFVTSDGMRYDLDNLENDELLGILHEWDYPIFELGTRDKNCIVSNMCYRIFHEVGLLETYNIPLREFFNYFHALELGYRDIPYHNRMHAADVLHSVYYLTSQPIPGFQVIDSDTDPKQSPKHCDKSSFLDYEMYGNLGANYPALELMALYVAATMHDYDHPGRTNAFLVTTHAPEAVLYNDRSVLENHHSASAWKLFMSSPDFNFLCHLDKAEFKRFRFLVIEAILATDLKHHFEILAEFNAKVNEEGSAGIDWTSEADRLLALQMCIKFSDINGPCKTHSIHKQWTTRIAEEFYEQGDEEVGLGLPISPYMDRWNPQLAKLQDSFMNHLVAPLCHAYGEAGLLPGEWVDCDEDDTPEEGSTLSESSGKETETEEDVAIKLPKRKVSYIHVKHLEENHAYWMSVIKSEIQQKESLEDEKTEKNPNDVHEGERTDTEAGEVTISLTMETIEEENTPSSEKEESRL